MKFCMTGEVSHKGLEKWGIIQSEVGFFLRKNEVYLHEKLSSLHKTHHTHKPRLIAGNSIIQTISLSKNENRTYSRDWPNCFLGGRRKVELQMVLMILQPWTLEIIIRNHPKECNPERRNLVLLTYILLTKGFYFWQEWSVLTLQPNFSQCSCTPPNQAFAALSGRFLFITRSILSQCYCMLFISCRFLPFLLLYLHSSRKTERE